MTEHIGTITAGASSGEILSISGRHDVIRRENRRGALTFEPGPIELRIVARFDEADAIAVFGPDGPITVEIDGRTGTTVGVATNREGPTVSFVCKPIKWEQWATIAALGDHPILDTPAALQRHPRGAAMITDDPTVECIARPDGRRGLWMRRTNKDERPVKVALFAGRDGGDGDVAFAVGDVVTDRQLYQLTEVLTTLRYAYEVAADNARGMRPLTDGQLAEWERLAEWPTGGRDLEEAEGAFIVAAREAIPALIAEVRRLRALYETDDSEDLWVGAFGEEPLAAGVTLSGPRFTEGQNRDTDAAALRKMILGLPAEPIHVVPADPVPPMHVTVKGSRGRVVDIHREQRLRRPTDMRIAVLFDEAQQSWLDGLALAGTPVALDIDCDGYPGKTTGIAISADGTIVHFICKPIEWLPPTSDTGD